MSKHTCDQLGVCNARTQADCCNHSCNQGRTCVARASPRYPFAPGVIDGPHRPAPRWRLRRLLPMLAVLAALGSAAGYCATHLGWLA